MNKPFFSPEELSERWGIPLSTLSQWRWNGKGPEFVKMGKRNRYKLEAVLLFEEQLTRKNTCSPQDNLYPEIKIKM